MGSMGALDKTIGRKSSTQRIGILRTFHNPWNSGSVILKKRIFSMTDSLFCLILMEK